MAKLTSAYNLAVVHPKIAKQWHPTRNGSPTPCSVTPSSSKRRWWRCQKGHEWQDTVSNRPHFQTGCPYRSGQRVCADNFLERVAPHLARQWHPNKNKALTPNDVTTGPAKKVWWLCKKGHEWEAIIRNRTDGNGCPYCTGFLACADDCLETLAPHVAGEWHPLKNGDLTPRDVTRGSNKKVWWICAKGHEWETTVNHRTDGNGCPGCAKEERRRRRLRRGIAQKSQGN